MWIVTGIISIIFCVIAWGITAKKSKNANWAMAGSLSFVGITLLMEYRIVAEWVNEEDWSALMDVVPAMFPVLCGYVVIMLVANIGVLVTNKKLRF